MRKCFRLTLLVILVFLNQGACALGNLSAPHRGAIWFMNYCAGCHGMRYMSWERMVADLALSPHDMISVNAHLQLTMPDLSKNWQHLGLIETDASQWFGKMPPDLSTIGRLRGHRWLRAYLTGFYDDPGRPFGVSNHSLEHVMMPNVLAPVQLEMTPQEFTNMINDIICFLEYAADPSRLVRYRIGLLFMSVLAIIATAFRWKRLAHKN